MPIAECRCGLPGANSSQEIWPGEVAEVECHNWWVLGGRGQQGGAPDALSLGSGPPPHAAPLPFQHLCERDLGVPGAAVPVLRALGCLEPLLQQLWGRPHLPAPLLPAEPRGGALHGHRHPGDRRVQPPALPR